MHEISIADAILDRALETANEHDAHQIDTLTIEVGRATHVNPSQIVFCIEAIAEGTIAEDAEIQTETLDPVAKCECGWEETPGDLSVATGFAPDVRCPDCGGQADLVQGRECRIASIEIPDAEPTHDRSQTRFREQAAEQAR